MALVSAAPSQVQTVASGRPRLGFGIVYLRMLGFLVSFGLWAACAFAEAETLTQPVIGGPVSLRVAFEYQVIVTVVLLLLGTLFAALAYRAWPRD